MLTSKGRGSTRGSLGRALQQDPSYEGAKQLVSLVSAHGGKGHLDERQGLDHEYPRDMAPTLARALAFVGE